MRRHWDAFQQLDWRERLRLIEAAVSLAIVWTGLRTAGFGRTRSTIARSPSLAFQRTPAAEIGATVAGFTRAVAVVARYSPVTATCLHKSLTLWWLLQRRGIESQLRIGTTRTDQGLSAHAWLERDGAVLNDDLDVRERFEAFEQFR